MKSHTISDAITKMAWIDRIAIPLQKAIGWTYRKLGDKVEGFFHGVFIGHPLHPSMVHLPLGGFIIAAITDLFLFNSSAAATSSIAIFLALVGMIPAMVTGATDWHPYEEVSIRRIGGLHVLLNMLALALYVLSLISRVSGSLGLGVTLGYLGFVSVMAAGYLGGLMVYEKRVGTDHAPQPEDEAAPNDYVVVMSEMDLPEGKITKAQVADVPIVLVRQGEKIFALANACAHEGGPLAEGKLENGCIVCPWHASCFRLEDGSVAAGPSEFPQPSFPVRVREGMIEVLAVRQLALPAPVRGRASLR